MKEGFWKNLLPRNAGDPLRLIREIGEVRSRDEHRALTLDLDDQDLDPQALGHGRLATREDLEDKLLLGDQGVPIGYFEGKPIRYPRGASGLIYGPPGIGKDTTHLAHILADFGGAQGPCPSQFIVDVAGESWEMSADYRERMQKKPPQRIAPFRTDGVRYNPIQPLIDLHANEQSLALHKYEIAKGFVPPDLRAHEGSWVRRKAINLTADLIHQDVYQHRHHCTPGAIFDQLNGGPEALAERFVAMSNGNDPHLAQAGRRYLFELDHSPREFGFAVDEAAEFLSIYQHGSALRAATAATDISPAMLKANSCTVYFEIPGDMLFVARQYVAAVINSFIEGVAMAEGKTRTLFLANEFTQIGTIPSLRKALRLYRKYGLTFILYAQSRAAVEEVYGEQGRRDIEETCEFIQILATDDPGLLRDISTWSGTASVEVVTHTLSGGPSPAVSRQVAVHTRPVLQAEDIRSLGGDEMLIKFQNMAPIILAERRHWQSDARLRQVLRDPSKMPGLVK